MRRELEKCQLNPLRQLYTLANLRDNIFGQTYYCVLVYTLFYYLIQCLFQFDIVCAATVDVEYLNEHSRATQIEICRSRLRTYFTLGDQHEQTMTRIITFLLGFYVSMIGKRWWEQVRNKD